MRGLATTLAITLLAAPSIAYAGTVYRCDSADGGRSYVSKRVKGAECTVVSSFRATRVPVAAMGAATPTARVEGSPATLTAGAPVSFSTPAAAPAPARAAAAAPSPSRPGSRLVQGQVYSYIKNGVRHYSSTRPRGVANASALRTIRYSFMETCFACAAKPGVSFRNLRLNTEAYRSEIAAAAAQHGVDEAIVRAIIHAESAFNPNAISRVGAQGLMQLMPATGRRFGVTNAFDPVQNIQGGVKYLAWLLRRFNGNLTLAAAGYNAGEGAVDRHKGVPPYSETQRYVERVNILADRYRGTPLAR